MAVDGLVTAATMGFSQAVGSMARSANEAGKVAKLSKMARLLTTTKDGVTGISTFGRVAQGVVGYTAGVAANKVVDRDTGFSWGQLAATALSSYVSAKVNPKGSFDIFDGGSDSARMLNRFAGGFFDGGLSATARRMAGGPKQNWGSIAISAAGQAAGEFFAEAAATEWDAWKTARLARTAFAQLTPEQQLQLVQPMYLNGTSFVDNCRTRYELMPDGTVLDTHTGVRGAQRLTPQEFEDRIHGHERALQEFQESLNSGDKYVREPDEVVQIADNTLKKQLGLMPRQDDYELDTIEVVGERLEPPRPAPTSRNIDATKRSESPISAAKSQPEQTKLQSAVASEMEGAHPGGQGLAVDAAENAVDAGVLAVKDGMAAIRKQSLDSIYNASSAHEAAVASAIYAINSVTDAVISGLVDTARLVTSSKARSEAIDGVRTLVTKSPVTTATHAWKAWSALPREDKLRYTAAAISNPTGVAKSLATAGKVASAAVEMVGTTSAATKTAVVTLSIPLLLFPEKMSPGETLRAKWGHLTASERRALLDAKAEGNAERYLDRLQIEARTVNSNAHFFDRHGFNTTLEQQYIRASTGLTPDNVQQNFLVDSSRFMTARDQVAAIHRANSIHQLTGQSVINVNMGSIVGEGFTRLTPNGAGLDYLLTTDVRTVFKNGSLYTQFPLLR